METRYCQVCESEQPMVRSNMRKSGKMKMWDWRCSACNTVMRGAHQTTGTHVR